MYDSIIANFCYLLKERPHLFVQHWAELEQFCITLPSAAEAVSDAIAQWCETDPEIYQALSSVTAAERDRITSKIPASNPSRDYGELIRNQIRESSPASPSPHRPLPFPLPLRRQNHE